jgi:hypothetical protein
MRIGVLAMVLSLAASPAAAQDSSDPEKCYPVTVAGLVEVTTHVGPPRTATLLCIGNTQVVLAADGRVTAIPLDDVREIVKPADGVADGFLKGAAVAAVFALLCWECGDTGGRASAIAVYGAIGAAIDALNGGRETLYRRKESNRGVLPATLAWRVRF